MAEHNEKGNQAEDIVAAYLAENKFTIIERNWHFGQKEIDIICKGEGKLIIVEVKARNTNNAETPSELLSRKKMKNLVDAAEAYIFKMNVEEEVRFDFALVIFDARRHSLEYVKEAFIPGVNW
ncbi:MAG: YraN family protein [Bacteroidales bacterium]|nr:YraN family protein [Bacteroidales bacterium]MCF8389163.1 YraN family protein [Bacteroidales bacterium]